MIWWGQIHLGPPPTMVRSNGFATIKITESKRNIKNRYIGNFMYMSFAAAVSVFCTACCVSFMWFSEPTPTNGSPFPLHLPFPFPLPPSPFPLPPPPPPPFVHNNLEINSDMRSA